MSPSEADYKPLCGITSVHAPRAVDRALTKIESETDPELARVLAAWPILPPALKAAVLAIVDSAVPVSKK
jgi:hypothetical protein